MTTDELLKHIDRLIEKGSGVRGISSADRYPFASGYYAEVKEFMRCYAGPKSSFDIYLANLPPSMSGTDLVETVTAILGSFKSHLSAGLANEISPERQAQLDVVSDFLGMAQSLLESKGVHPAAPAVIIGAALEEFLRTWVENDNLPLGNRPRSLETYSQVLREANLLTKQDGKDITAWAGIRNSAAHGEWDQVADPKRIAIMLEHVNLFMSRNS